MSSIHPDAELAPRSVVAQAIFETMRRDGVDHVRLDVSHLDSDFLRERFPGVYQGALERGYDMTTGPIPVAPAAHYHMGGVYTDIDGRTTIRGLYAAGECASTGAHGANRVASNSLLEAAVFSSRAVESVLRNTHEADMPDEDVTTLRIHPHGGAPSWQNLKRTMSELVGISRTGEDLRAAIERFDHWSAQRSDRGDASLELGTLTARRITEAALQRTETRGSHLRLDFPETNPDWQRHSLWQLARE